MAPFHKVDFLELINVHVWVQKLEFGGCSVFIEFGLPIFGGEGRERSGDRLPFCDTESAIVNPDLHKH